MKNTLKTLLAACALLGTVACEKDEILDQMSVAFEQEAYTVAPHETLEIPFTSPRTSIPNRKRST